MAAKYRKRITGAGVKAYLIIFRNVINLFGDLFSGVDITVKEYFTNTQKPFLPGSMADSVTGRFSRCLNEYSLC